MQTPAGVHTGTVIISDGFSQAIPTLSLWFVITSHTTSINKYTHNALACTVQGLHNTASTIAHSHCLAFTYNTVHSAKRTPRGPDFQKRCCCWQFSIKI